MHPRFFAITLAPLALLACSPDQDTIPLAPSPSFGVTSNSNATTRVTRYQDELGVAWTDPGSNLRATHWTSRFFVEPGCGDFEGGPIWFQQVGLIDVDDFFASDLHLNARGPVWIIVRDLNQPGTCFGAKLVAEGWGTVHYTDNDAFGTDNGEPRTNAWGFMAGGELTAPDGRSRSYNGHVRISVTANAAHNISETAQIVLR